MAGKENGGRDGKVDWNWGLESGDLNVLGHSPYLSNKASITYWQGHGKGYAHSIYLLPNALFLLAVPSFLFSHRKNNALLGLAEALLVDEAIELLNSEGWLICGRNSVFSGSSLASEVMDGHLSGIVPWSISHKVSNYFVKSIDQTHRICPNSFIVKAGTGKFSFSLLATSFLPFGFSVGKTRSGEWKSLPPSTPWWKDAYFSPLFRLPHVKSLFGLFLDFPSLLYLECLCLLYTHRSIHLLIYACIPHSVAIIHTVYYGWLVL